MDKNENNGTVPDDRRKPGDVYIMLSTEGKIQAISVNDTFYKRFGDFVNDCAYYTLKDMAPPYGNSFLVQYRFYDPDEIPAGNPYFHGYSRLLDTAIKEENLKPENTLRLHAVMYCHQNGLNPLLPENSEQALKRLADYNLATFRYCGMGNLATKACTGIQTDRGVLLFDDTQRGEDLQRKYREFYANHFFDPRLDITFFRTLELIPTGEQKMKINPDLDALYDSGPQPFGQLSADRYTDMKEIGIYTENERVDMSPTLRNFAAISETDKGEIPDLPADTYDIGCLLYLASPECTDPVIQDEFPNFFSYYDRFDPLAERVAEARTAPEKAQAMAQVREMAGQILRQDFPGIRQPRPDETARKERRKAGLTPEGDRAKSLPDVAGKLAKLPKKNGLSR